MRSGIGEGTVMVYTVLELVAVVEGGGLLEMCVARFVTSARDI